MNAKTITATVCVFFTAIYLHGSEGYGDGFYKLLQPVQFYLRIFSRQSWGLGTGDWGLGIGHCSFFHLLLCILAPLPPCHQGEVPYFFWIGKYVIPFHEKPDTDVNPESFAASKFFNCELR
ncbi:hypothetical protein [Nostoc sp. CMAA1605]|uniref:hypothetical protein n=1 Tax=Nostoc sp. CMAA1605 TaxID=2055159 RepID=UPI001F3C388A|nr:hypothetical protein [Nostoc sp. CMAA1605]